jgi:hypothetical protein
MVGLPLPRHAGADPARALQGRPAYPGGR